MKYAAYIFCVVVLIVAGVFIWRKLNPEKPEVIPPPPVSGSVPTVTAPSITHGNASLPHPDEHITGVLHIKIPADTTGKVGDGIPREIFIYLNDDPGKAPEVRSTTPIQSTFAPVVDPWIMLQVHLMVGGSADNQGEVSPWGGVAVVRFLRTIDIGVGIDNDGIGIFTSYTFFRDFSIGAQWYVLPVFDSDARYSVVLSYRF